MVEIERGILEKILNLLRRKEKPKGDPSQPEGGQPAQDSGSQPAKAQPGRAGRESNQNQQTPEEINRQKLVAKVKNQPALAKEFPDLELLSPAILEALEDAASVNPADPADARRNAINSSFRNLKGLAEGVSVPAEIKAQAHRALEALKGLLGELPVSPAEPTMQHERLSEIESIVTHYKEYKGQVRQLLKKIYGTLKVNPGRIYDSLYWEDQIRSFEMAKGPIRDKRKIIEEIQKKIREIKGAGAGLPRGLSEEAFGRADDLHGRTLRAREALAKSSEELLGKNKGTKMTDNQVLKDLYNMTFDHEAAPEILEERLKDIEGLLETLPDDEKSFARNIHDLLKAQMDERKFAGETLTRLTDKDIESIFSRISSEYSAADLNFIKTTLASSENFLAYLRKNRNFESIDQYIRKLYNIMFREVDEHPSNSFEDNFSIFYHKPGKDAFMTRMRKIKEGLATLPDSMEHYYLAQVYDPQLKRIVAKQIHIKDLVAELYENLRGEYEYREYIHNAYHILKARGELKTLAGYAHKLSSEHIARVFGQDRHIQAAYRLFDQVISNELGLSEWILNPKMFQDVVGQGEMISKRVSELMKTHFADENDGKGLEPWQLSRAISLARGTIFGVTGVGIDYLGEADPPSDRSGYYGYFGDRILYGWNLMRHHFYRWFTKHYKYNKTLYIEVRNEGTLRGWSPKEVDAFEEKHLHDRFTNLRQYVRNPERHKAEIRPFIQISNILDIAGPMGRKGWGDRAYIDHLIVGPRLAGNVPDYQNFTLEDWQVTKSNLARAGANFLYWWASDSGDNVGTFRAAIEERLSSMSSSNNAEWSRWVQKLGRNPVASDFVVTVEDVYRALRAKHPMYFLSHDNTPLRYYNGEKANRYIPGAFRKTIRGSALYEIRDKLTGEGWNTIRETLSDSYVPPGEFRKIWEQNPGLLELEGDIMLLTDTIVDLRVDSLTDSVLSRVKEKITHSVRQKEAIKNVDISEDALQEKVNKRVNLAKSYWTALQTSITDTMIDTDFADRRIPYSLGTATMDPREVDFTEAGQSMPARRFGDASKMMEDVANPLLVLDEILTNVGLSPEEAFKELDKYLVSARKAYKEIHGIDAFYVFSRRIHTLLLRYLQKAVWARLPFGVGSIASLGKGSSLVKGAQGIWAKDFDEQKMYARIQHAITSDFLDEKNARILMAEVGARPIQMAFDIGRSVVPLVFSLATITGLAMGKKDTEDK